PQPCIPTLPGAEELPHITGNLVEVTTVTDSTDPIADLQARVAFLEDTLYSLAALLTGKVNAANLPATSVFPVNAYDQGRILTAFAEVLTGDRTTTCPVWCRVDGSGGATQRPSNWPAGKASSGS
ncbi:MAG: hypothetical protein WBQ66_19560, partial [Blastocatellia bacterium]